MSKKPTPKHHKPRSATRSHFAAFQFRSRKHLKNFVNLVACSNCGQMRKTHFTCPTCGFYRGRKVLDLSKATKKAVQKIKV